MAPCVDADVVSTISPQTTGPDTAPQPFSTPAGVVAPSSPMARAARDFGDAYPPVRGHWFVRCAGIAYLVSAAIYIPWLFSALNRQLPWLAWPFLAANLFTLATTLLSIFNHWWRRVPEPHPLPRGAEPSVGIIVPCCGEPVAMILRTITSILEQDWPRDRMVIMVSDDGHDLELAAAVRAWPVLYHLPPPRSAPGRDGAAKAGNLNSAMGALVAAHPELGYIETRDCDDELGSNQFLRQAVGQLEHDTRLAFVQTIKETQVSAGDPFNNREAMFYRGQMLSRYAANATFPCGSGLVWRRSALEQIGLFPTWNLVEDLQSGVEALRRGWDSCYLPIVGAMGQHSPEDVPNVYKQRGTWAIDTVRLMLWGDLRGLNVRQRAQFYELLCYYLHSFTVLVYVPSIVGALLGYLPFTASGTELPRAHASDRARHRGVADGDQSPLQRSPPPSAQPRARAVARTDHLERLGAGVHQGLDPGDSRRARAQAGLQGHAQAQRSPLALGPHAAADDRAADGRCSRSCSRCATARSRAWRR